MDKTPNAASHDLLSTFLSYSTDLLDLLRSSVTLNEKQTSKVRDTCMVKEQETPSCPLFSRDAIGSKIRKIFQGVGNLAATTIGRSTIGLITQACRFATNFKSNHRASLHHISGALLFARCERGEQPSGCELKRSHGHCRYSVQPDLRAGEMPEQVIFCLRRIRGTNAT
jgi:hypothetical protein